jgi:hypothetical protein
MSAYGTKQTLISTLNMSLSGAKRTSLISTLMSANDPSRTTAPSTPLDTGQRPAQMIKTMTAQPPS